jgi:hypothetical protein
VHKIPEERRLHLHRGGSLKFLKKKKYGTMLKKLSSAYKDKKLEENITTVEINIFCKCATKTTTANEHIFKFGILFVEYFL